VSAAGDGRVARTVEYTGAAGAAAPAAQPDGCSDDVGRAVFEWPRRRDAGVAVVGSLVGGRGAVGWRDAVIQVIDSRNGNQTYIR
jgi:hypothetical protein